MSKNFTLRYAMLSLFALLSIGLTSLRADNPVSDYPGDIAEGEDMLYESSTFYQQRAGASWSYGNMLVQKVRFDGNKLYLFGTCGAQEWIVGEIEEGGELAYFKSGQMIDETSSLKAYVNDGNGDVEIEGFYFKISRDRSQVWLRNEDEGTVVLAVQYASGYSGVRWRDTLLTHWTTPEPEAPADGEASYMTMKYNDGYGDSERTVKTVRKGDDIWMKGLVYETAYMQGKVLDNGDIRFETPQYQGPMARYFSFAYAMKSGAQVDKFDLTLKEDGSYAMEDDIELWRGDARPDYMVVSGMTLTPSDVYVGAPAKPENVEWNGDMAHMLGFTLPMTGKNGEELNRAWTYWQILSGGEPYAFTNAEYGGWSFLESVDKVGVTETFYSRINGEFIQWGAQGDNRFLIYLPSFSAADGIEVRCGYEVDGEMYWSEAVKADKTGEATPYPSNALYSSTISYFYGDYSYDEEGIAMRAGFDGMEMEMSGFFGCGEYIYGTFTDETRKKAEFGSGQDIGVTEDGRVISLVAAKCVSPGDEYTPGVFDPVESFVLTVGKGAAKITHEEWDVYLLEVVGDEIVSVWSPGMTCKIVTDELPVAPADALSEVYTMEYYNSFSATSETTVEIYFKDDKAWAHGLAGEDTWMQGYLDGDDIVFDLPQFVGTSSGYVAYATANAWDFWESRLTLKGDGEGNYSCTDGEVWIGTGLGYPLWRYAMMMELTRTETSVKAAAADEAITFEGGRFVTASGAEVEVYTVGGQRVANKNLQTGVYIVKTTDKTLKLHVK